MPVNMADLYAQDPGVLQVNPDVGQVAEPPPSVQTTNAQAEQVGPAVTINPSQVATTSTATATMADPAEGAIAGSAVPGVSGITSDRQATTDVVDPLSTVQRQMTDITRRASPLMERARMVGVLAAGKRGLQNTNIAGGMSQGAMVDRALPIAQQDASTYFSQQRANQDALNEQNLAAMDVESRAAFQEAELATQTSQFNVGELNDLSALNAQLGTQTSQFNADQRNRISALNAQMEQDASRFNAEEQNRIAELNAQMVTETNIRNANAKDEGAFLDANIRAQIVDANASRALALEQGNVQEANDQTQFIMDMNNALNVQFLAGEQAMTLADIQGRYQQLISANGAAAELYGSYFDAISGVMANQKITPARVAGHVSVLQQMLDSGLALIEATNNLDLSGEDGELEVDAEGNPIAGPNRRARRERRERQGQT